jgi:hypothetical protein
MVQFYTGGRPKAVTGPARAAACHWPCQIVGPSPCPIGPSAHERAQSLALCAAPYFHRDRLTCRWIDMR